jgi:predicted nucleic acid-binding protein
MIVADASALLQVLSLGGNATAINARLFTRSTPICVPHLVDAEIASILRKHVLLGRIARPRARDALQDFLDLSLIRFQHTPLLPRVFALAHTVTAYDAFYVALAESLNAPLVTCDGRLARALTGIVAVEVF